MAEEPGAEHVADVELMVGVAGKGLTIRFTVVELGQPEGVVLLTVTGKVVALPEGVAVTVAPVEGLKVILVEVLLQL